MTTLQNARQQAPAEQPSNSSTMKNQASATDFKATHTPGPYQVSATYNAGRKDGKRLAIICAPHPDGGGQNIAECIEECAPLFCAVPALLKALIASTATLIATYGEPGQVNCPAGVQSIISKNRAIISSL